MRAIALALALIATPAAAADPKCESVIRTMQGVGFIKSMKAATDGVHLVVQERSWNSMQFTDKEDVGKNFTCATLDPGQQYTVILFRSDLTNKILGRYQSQKLTIP